MIYAVGAQTDRHMGIPGEDLPGSWAATEFVAWYNGHPDFRDLEFDLSCKRAVVIGNGNVAMDVARMLVLPREELEVTDTTDHAIDAIAESGVEEVVIVGRRGPAQAAFTNPELLRARRADRRRRDRGPGRRGARRPQRALDRGRGRDHPPPQRRDPDRLLRAGARRASASGWCCASCARRWRSRATARSRRSSWCATSSSTAATAACAPRPRASTRRWSAGWCSARSATAGCRSRACRSTSGTARSPTRRGA